MQLMLVLGSVMFVLLTVALARWFAARALEDALDADDDLTDRLALLPEGHQPPPGLSPLSPSERFLQAEARRGMRDLQLYLHDAA